MTQTRNGIKLIVSRGCGKRKEAMEWEVARDKAIIMSKREGWKYNHYYCSKCRMYHVGHAFPRERVVDHRRASCQ
jgi:hypothetical protein